MDTNQQDETPSLDQIILGIGTALLTAMEHVECAKLLLDQKKPKQAYSLWILAAEEVGKVALYSRCLKVVLIEREKAWNDCKKIVKDHKAKLEVFFDLLDKLAKLDSNLLSFNMKFDLGSKIANEQLDALTKAHNTGHLKHMLHSFRECATYTIINNQSVVSPGRSMMMLPQGLLELVIQMSATVFISIEKLLSEVLGPAHVQLREHFGATTAGKEKAAYARLTKTVERVLPSMMEIVRRFQKGEISVKDDPSYVKLIKQFESASLKKLIVVAFMLKKVIELSASNEVFVSSN
jgi:AbiV family abortive infection protein